MSWHTISPYHTTWLITKKTLQCLQFFYAPWRDITAIPREASRTVIEVLQKELDSGPSSQQYRSTCIKCLRVLVRHRDMLPSSFFCRNVRRVGTHPVSGGGFADIWKGSIAGKTVCVKVLRFFSANATGQNLVKDCFQEAVVWKQLKHPNVLPFLGVNQDLFAPSFCLISPWMENGNIIYFLSKHPTHNRLQCLLEIAEGLKYLHELDPQITHADVRGANILIDSERHCLLADFGLSLVSETCLPGSSAILKGSLRWLPPEVMDYSLFDPAYLTARDIYSFGCTVIEIYTGRPPFSHIKTEVSLINEVLTQKRKPPRPPLYELSSDELWNLVEACLANLPQDRPSINTVLACLKLINVPCTCVAALRNTLGIAPRRERALPVEPSIRRNRNAVSHVINQLVPIASVNRAEKSSPIHWVRCIPIGSEAYVQTYRAIDTSSGKRFDIVVKQVQTILSPDLSRSLRRLSDILQAYPHPNIWTHLGFEQTPSSTNMFFEYFPSRTLQEFLAQRGALGFSGMSRHLLGQIISGVAFLHSKDIVHWDLRTDNVFVDNKGCCKISGFAVSKYITSARICTIDPRFRPIRDVRTICGAPECMTHIGEGPPGPAVDIWSVGLIAYEVWMGLKQEDYQEILRCFFKHWEGHPVHSRYLPPPKALRFPILADDFRRGCLAFAPEERFSAERLRHHEYLETTPPV